MEECHIECKIFSMVLLIVWKTGDIFHDQRTFAVVEKIFSNAGLVFVSFDDGMLFHQPS